MQILSALHLKHRGNPLPPVSPDADVIVLAGDLAPGRTNRIGDVMRTWRYPDLLYVHGNHEWYGSEIDAARRELARQCRDHGVELLDPGVVDVDQVRFVGATLWTDFRLDPAPHAEAWAHHEVGVFIPDFKGSIQHWPSPSPSRSTRSSILKSLIRPVLHVPCAFAAMYRRRSRSVSTPGRRCRSARWACRRR